MSAHPAGHQLIRFHDETRGRPVLVDAWYPVERGTIEAEHTYGLGRGRVAEGAAEGHFAYLDVCDADREANGVPLCRDRPGVDRGRLHGRLAEVITGVFDRHLRPN